MPLWDGPERTTHPEQLLGGHNPILELLQDVENIRGRLIVLAGLGEGTEQGSNLLGVHYRFWRWLS